MTHFAVLEMIDGVVTKLLGPFDCAMNATLFAQERMKVLPKAKYFVMPLQDS